MNIEELIEIFKCHSKELESSKHHKTGDFNLPQAFLLILKEIKGLKDVIHCDCQNKR